MWLSGGGGEQGRSWGSQTTGKMGIKKINIISSGYLQELWSIKPLQTLNCWIQSLSVSPSGETGLESPELLGTGFFINQSKRKKKKTNKEKNTTTHNKTLVWYALSSKGSLSKVYDWFIDSTQGQDLLRMCEALVSFPSSSKTENKQTPPKGVCFQPETLARSTCMGKELIFFFTLYVLMSYCGGTRSTPCPL